MRSSFETNIGYVLFKREANNKLIEKKRKKTKVCWMRGGFWNVGCRWSGWLRFVPGEGSSLASHVIGWLPESKETRKKRTKTETPRPPSSREPHLSLPHDSSSPRPPTATDPTSFGGNRWHPAHHYDPLPLLHPPLGPDLTHASYSGHAPPSDG